MVATAELTLEDASDNIRTHDLKIENSGSLFLYFCQTVTAGGVLTHNCFEVYTSCVSFFSHFLISCLQGMGDINYHYSVISVAD